MTEVVPIDLFLWSSVLLRPKGSRDIESLLKFDVNSGHGVVVSWGRDRLMAFLRLRSLYVVCFPVRCHCCRPPLSIRSTLIYPKQHSDVAAIIV